MLTAPAPQSGQVSNNIAVDKAHSEDAPTEWMAVTGMQLVPNVGPWRPNPSFMFLAFFLSQIWPFGSS